MAEVRQGRWTARIEGDFVVFLIGAKLQARHPLRSFNDLGGLRGMQHMLKHLEQHPEKGLLGYESAGFTIIQYWRSFADLERFANDPDAPHKPAWRRYWRRVGREPRSGIWHETFLVRAGEYEAVYGNLAPRGLGKAADLVPLREDATARKRLKGLAGQI